MIHVKRMGCLIFVAAWAMIFVADHIALAQNPIEDDFAADILDDLGSDDTTLTDAATGEDTAAAEPQGPTLEEVWSEAQTLIEQENYDEAIEKLDSMILGLQYTGGQLAQQVIPAAKYERAMCFVNLEEYELAISALTEVQQTLPYPVRIAALNVELAPYQVLLELGRLKLDLPEPRVNDAVEHFTEALEMRPTDPEILLNHGKALSRQARRIQNRRDAVGAYEAAVDSIDKSISRKDGDAEAYFERGSAKSDLASINGQWDEAIEDLQKATELDTENLEYTVQLGLSYLQRGKQKAARRKDEDLPDVVSDHRRAIELFGSFIQKHPNLPLSAGGPLGPDDEKQEAEDDETALENAIIARSDARMSLAKYLPEDQRDEHYRHSIDDCDLALEVEEDYPLAYFNRGVARRLLLEFDAAVDDFSEVMLVSPNLGVSAALRRGIVRYYQADYDLALADFERASIIRDGRANFWIGVCKAKLGDDMGAIEAYSEALRQNPGYTFAYNNRGLSYLRTQFYERALDDFNELIRRNRDSSEAYRRRGLAYAGLNRQDDANRSFQMASQLASKETP